MAFVGLGAVGTAALRLMLAQAIHPSELILCDVPVKAAELERLAHEVCSEFRYEGRVNLSPLASGNVPDEVYRSRFVIAATNVPGVLDVERLSPGTIVVDDLLPHCFETDRAISRMSSCAPLFDGGLAPPPGSMEWNVTLPPAVNSLVVGHFQESMLPRQNAITACILSSLTFRPARRHGYSWSSEREVLRRALGKTGVYGNWCGASTMRELVADRRAYRKLWRPVFGQRVI